MLSGDLLKYIESFSVKSEDFDVEERLSKKVKKKEIGGRRKVAKDKEMTLLVEQLANDEFFNDRESNNLRIDDDQRSRGPSRGKLNRDTIHSNGSTMLTTEQGEGKIFRRNDKKKTSKKLGIEENDLVDIDENYEINVKLEHQYHKEKATDDILDELLISKREMFGVF